MHYPQIQPLQYIKIDYIRKKYPNCSISGISQIKFKGLGWIDTRLSDNDIDLGELDRRLKFYRFIGATDICMLLHCNGSTSEVSFKIHQIVNV